MLADSLPPELAAAPWIYRPVDDAGAYGTTYPSLQALHQDHPGAAAARERSAGGLCQRQIVHPFASPIATWRA